MKAQNILVGHIYYVNFEPVRKGEFGKQHLAVAIKKNYDKITYVVIPMTSKERGEGINKVPLGRLDCLPKNLQVNESYAVIDQIRTVDASRFLELMEDGEVIEAVMPEDKMVLLYKAIIKDLLHDVPEKDILKIFF